MKVYRASESEDLKKDFAFRDQIRRSAVSVASNLAEGDERGTDREAVRFFYMAKGSVAELRTQIQIACETGYVKTPLYDSLEAEYGQVAKMIGGLIRARSQPSSPSPRAPRLD